MKHPEDEIFRVRQFIKELSNVQDQYFKQLSEELGMNEDGDDWLFDYVFNGPIEEPETFEEYLERYGKTFGEMK
jgi:hypothetical protein